MYKVGQDNKLHKWFTMSKAHIVLKELHEGVARGHFVVDITTKKILDVDIHEFCKSYDNYQKIGGLKMESLTKLVTTIPKEPFMKWGLNFTNMKEIHFSSYKICNQVGRNKGTHNQYYSSHNQFFICVYFDHIWMPFNHSPKSKNTFHQ